MDWCNNRFLRATVAGVALGIGFVVPPLWPAAILGLLLTFDLLKSSHWSIADIALGWWLITVKALFSVSFFFSVYPITWLGFSLGPLEPYLIAFYWLTAAIWIGFGGAVLFSLFAGLRRLFSERVVLLTTPLLFVVSEIVGALSFSVMTYGPGGSVNIAYSYGMIGYHLADHQLLLHGAHLAGAYSLTALIVLVALVAWWLQQQQKRVLLILYVLVIVGTSVGTIPIDTETKTPSTVTVATIDTTFPKAWWYTATGSAAIDAAQQAMVTAALQSEPDYLVLPEDGRFVPQQTASATQAWLDWAWAGRSTVLVDSGRAVVDDQPVLQSVVYDGLTQELSQSQKRYLVPQGEFLPYFYEAILRLSGNQAAIDFLEEKLEFRVTDDVSQADYSDRAPGVLFCFESNYPLAVHTLLRERPDGFPFVAHVVSHAWFNDSPVLRHQLEAMLQAQAVWNDVYIVVAANHAPGYTITPRGTILIPDPIASGPHWELRQVTIPLPGDSE